MFLLPGAAWAHGDVDAAALPLLEGLIHPVLAPVHLLATISIGLFAFMAGDRARVAYPSSSLGGLIAGLLVGHALPLANPFLVASIFVLSIATIAFVWRWPFFTVCTTLGFLGAAHGYLHELEGPEFGCLQYASGLILTTLALFGIGVLFGVAVGDAGRLVTARVLGAMTCLAGLALAIG
jgi:hydrogenase/urease accessory protein HupE